MQDLQLQLSSVTDLVTQKLEGWFDNGAAMLPNLVVAALVVVVFGLAGRWVSGVMRRVAQRQAHSEALTNLVATLVRVGIVATGVFVALSVLELEKTVTSLLAGAGIIGLALGFAFQDIAENLIAGLMLGLRRPLQVGDVIESNDIMGVVKSVNLRNTVLQSFAGQRILLPNKKVFNEILTNYSASGQRRVDIAVGVTYDADLLAVTEILSSAVTDLDCRDPSKEAEVFCVGFGGSSIDFSARFWINYPGQASYLQASHAGHLAVRAALQENNITIPFPIRTLDFGIEGGQGLQEHLQHVISLDKARAGRSVRQPSKQPSA